MADPDHKQRKGNLRFAGDDALVTRIEYEVEMAARGEEEEDNQDFGEFCEDRYVELYGLKKIAEGNLRDLLKGLRHASKSHVRLEIFRQVSALVILFGRRIFLYGPWS